VQPVFNYSPYRIYYYRKITVFSWGVSASAHSLKPPSPPLSPPKDRRWLPLHPIRLPHASILVALHRVWISVILFLVTERPSLVSVSLFMCPASSNLVGFSRTLAVAKSNHLRHRLSLAAFPPHLAAILSNYYIGISHLASIISHMHIFILHQSRFPCHFITVTLCLPIPQCRLYLCCKDKACLVSFQRHAALACETTITKSSYTAIPGASAARRICGTRVGLPARSSSALIEVLKSE